MKFVAQRVLRATLTVNGQLVSEIGRGLVVFLGVKTDDGVVKAEKIAEKIAKLRVFSDENGKMNLCVRDIVGEVLLVSQFTLYGDAQKGNRPSFTAAARPELADPLYSDVARILKETWCVSVKTGVFGADMRILQENDGPVTIIYEI